MASLLWFYLFVSAPNVAPSDVGGGGGSNRELTITWAVSVKKLHMLFVALPTLNLKPILFPEINNNASKTNKNKLLKYFFFSNACQILPNLLWLSVPFLCKNRLLML